MNEESEKELLLHCILVGPPQLKKSLKFQLPAKNFLDTSPSSKNVSISYQIVIMKFFFQNFKFAEEELTNSLALAPYWWTKC